jgi:proteasome accessory factor B
MTSKKMYSQAARVQGLLRTLGTRQGITLAELAEEFRVTKRTIYRDIKAIEDSGYPIFSDVIEGTTYWRLEPSFKNIPPITFTQNELMALYFSRKLLRSTQGSPFHTDLESAFKKIESALPAKHIAKLERIEQMFSSLVKMPGKVDIDKQIFETIQMALINQNILKLKYMPKRSNQAFPFEAHPYSLLLYKEELYLLCFIPEKKALRYFALSGIKKAERLKERFEIPESFSLSDFINLPFGIYQEKPIKVEVIFDKELSDYIQERTWHPSQKIKVMKDGKILLSMIASGKDEIKAWILSFGPKAEVLSPEFLRKEIKADILKTVDRYRHP